METFVIASNNPQKVQELNRILNPMGITAKTAKELGVPVKFIGVGEQMDDLQPFDADDFAKALFTKV